MNPIGDVVVTARIARGLTQEDLAVKASVTQAALSRYENGLRAPEPDIVRRLAAALGVTETFLATAGRAWGAMAVDVHLRRRATEKATVWRRIEATLNMHRMHIGRLFEEVSLHAEQTVPTFDPVDTDPASAARFVRMQWRMPVGPVRSLTHWMESAGCVLIEEDFGTARVDGLSQWAGSHPVVLVNQRVPTDRKRLTLAHELGHLCLHTAFVSQDIETEANQFAAEFLMPREVIRPQLRNLSLGRLLDLKREWMVSIQDLIERAHDVGALPAQRRTALYKSLSARGYRTREPGSEELPPEHPRLVSRIAETLLARGLSGSEVAQIAGYAGEEHNHTFPTRRPSLHIV